MPPGTFAAPEVSLATATSRTVSLFYPKPGQDPNGLCWLGLTSDRAGNLYPVGGAGDFSKLDPNANLLRGKDDTNFFATGGNSNWGTLDQGAQKLFTAALTTVRSAPFRGGARFSVFASGLKTAGEAVAIGRGPLAGSLLVTDAGASRVYRVTLNPVTVKLFASGPLFKVPEAIASAPNGTVYVVNVGSTTDPAGRTLVKITPGGIGQRVRERGTRGHRRPSHARGRRERHRVLEQRARHRSLQAGRLAPEAPARPT